MNGRLRLGLLAAVVTSLAAIPLLPQGLDGQEVSGRFRVMVPEFKGQEGADGGFGKRLGEELRDLINEQMSTHQPIEERELRNALRQFDLDWEDLTCITARQLAGQIDAAVIFCGSYTQEGDDITVGLEMWAGNGEQFVVDPVTVPRRDGQHPAAQHYYQALQVQSDQARAARFCAEYATSQNWAEAIQNCDRAIELNPASTSSRFTRGQALRNLERFEEALEEFVRVLELDGLREDAMQIAGYLSAQLGREEDAREYYRRYLELNPANAGIRMTIARELYDAGDPVGAMQFIEEGLALDGENVDLLMQHGGYAFAAGAEAAQGTTEMPAEAAELFRKALDSYGQAYGQLGAEMEAGHLRSMLIVMINLEDYEGAISLAEQVLQTHSEESGLWSVYADVLQRSGRIDEAIEALDRVLELDPEADRVKARQGNWLLQVNRVEDAVPILQDAVARGEQTADEVAYMLWSHGYSQGIQPEEWSYARSVFNLAKEFDVSEEMGQQLDFWLGYAILKIYAIQQEPNTLETAQATLPRFQEALRLLQSSRAYAQRENLEATRQQLVGNVNTYIEIQEAIIRRGR